MKSKAINQIINIDKQVQIQWEIEKIGTNQMKDGHDPDLDPMNQNGIKEGDNIIQNINIGTEKERISIINSKIIKNI